jgi:hypothetical protein
MKYWEIVASLPLPTGQTKTLWLLLLLRVKSCNPSRHIAGTQPTQSEVIFGDQPARRDFMQLEARVHLLRK